jgi:hypothetical protein
MRLFVTPNGDVFIAVHLIAVGAISVCQPTTGLERSVWLARHHPTSPGRVLEPCRWQGTSTLENRWFYWRVGSLEVSSAVMTAHPVADVPWKLRSQSGPDFGSGIGNRQTGGFNRRDKCARDARAAPALQLTVWRSDVLPGDAERSARRFPRNSRRSRHRSVSGPHRS